MRPASASHLGRVGTLARQCHLPRETALMATVSRSSRSSAIVCGHETILITEKAAIALPVLDKGPITKWLTKRLAMATGHPVTRNMAMRNKLRVVIAPSK